MKQYVIFHVIFQNQRLVEKSWCILLAHNPHDHDMTIIKEIRVPIARLTDPHTDPLIDVTPATDIDHAPIKR